MGALRRTVVVLLLVCVAAGAAPRVADAAYAGGNGKIAYENFVRGQIIVSNLDRSGAVSFAGIDPVWSPDGRRLAYARPTGGIVVANPDGSSRTVLRRTGESPTWSPDGKRLAFSADGVVYVMSATGSNVTRLRAGYDPAWSPDGALIAFNGGGDDSVNLYTMRTDGTGVRRLTSHATTSSTGSYMADWSPDGTRIAYSQGGSGCSAVLRVMNRDGSAKTTLTSAQCNSWYPAWAPDGKSLFLGKDWFGTPGENGGLYRINADGSSLRVFRRGYFDNASLQPLRGATATALAASPTSVSAGSATQLTATVTRSGTSIRVPFETVTFEVRRSGTTTWASVGKVRTDGRGRAVLSHVPQWNAQYRVRLTAANGWTASTSPVVNVTRR